MKKLDTLKKELQTITLAEIQDIAKHNKNLNYDAIMNNDFSKLCLLFYRELKKAVDSKESSLELNCNYAKRRYKDSDIIDVYDFAINSNNIQVYVKKRCCAICTTKKSAFAEALASSELNFIATAKKTHKEAIAFDDVCNILKQVIAVVKLTDSAQLELKKQDTVKAE